MMTEQQEQSYCQSCAMPLTDEERGTEKNGALSADYCKYCYQNGAFTSEGTMENMIDSCIPFTLESNVYPDAQTARSEMMKFFPTLKRWSKAEA